MTDKWLVIDAHTHFLPEEAILTAKEKGLDFSAITVEDHKIPLNKTRDIEGLLRIMGDAGVDMAVLNMSQWSSFGLEVCRAMNNSYARIERNYPGKFILCGHAPLQQGQEVVDEIERCINELGFKGIALSSSSPDVALDSPTLWPIYEKINQLGVPIVIHPTVRSPLWGGGENTSYAAPYPGNMTLLRLLSRLCTASSRIFLT